MRALIRPVRASIRMRRPSNWVAQTEPAPTARSHPSAGRRGGGPTRRLERGAMRGTVDGPSSGCHPEGLRHSDADPNRSSAARRDRRRLARAANCCRREERDDGQPGADPHRTACGIAWTHRFLPLRGWLPGYTAGRRRVPPSSAPAASVVQAAALRMSAPASASRFQALRRRDEAGKLPGHEWRRSGSPTEPLQGGDRSDGRTLREGAMPEIEYAVDIWDLSGTDGRPNAEQLLEHLREFAAEGWELVSLSFNIDLVRHGPSHLLVFKRAGGVGSN